MKAEERGPYVAVVIATPLELSGITLEMQPGQPKPAGLCGLGGKQGAAVCDGAWACQAEGQGGRQFQTTVTTVSSVWRLAWGDEYRRHRGVNRHGQCVHGHGPNMRIVPM